MLQVADEIVQAQFLLNRVIRRERQIGSKSIQNAATWSELEGKKVVLYLSLTDPNPW